MKRILRYLAHTPTLGLWYPKGSEFNLVGFSDAVYAGDKVDRKSTSGTCHFLGRSLVCWSSKKQNCVSLSTAESEYIAAGSCCAQLLWMKQTLKDYGIHLKQVPLYYNNESAIKIANNPVQHSKTKHIEIRHHFLRDHVVKEDVDIIMDSFYEGEIDLLLSTTIIENGIDVRNANLLLIENADKFGLAQLYQIKGRVGRGDKIAYAYLMIRPNKEITPQSKKRLKAIQDFTELGSGYKIAQRDLLIRGAGDILGKEQAGFIDEVGIDLYIRLLNETIKEKEGKAPKINQKPIKSLQSIDAYIPQTFAENDNKIEIYQKIISINNVDELNKYQEVLTDQYGKLPNNVELLFKKREIDIYFAGDPFDSYNDYKDRIDIKLNSDFSNINGIGSTLFTALIIYINKIKVSYREKQINISVLKISDWLETLIKVLSIIRRVENEVKGAKIYED